MLSTPHLLVGAAIGASTGDPVLAFAGGFLSHLVLDAIPHTDQELLDNPEHKGLLPADYFPVILDIIVGWAIVLYFTRDMALVAACPILLGALGGIAPDLISNVPFWSPALLKLPVIKQFHALHVLANHHILSEQPKMLGVTTQFVAIVIAVTILARL